MGKVIRSVVRPLTSGLASEVKPTTAKRSYWDIEKEAKPAQQDYAQVLERSRALSAAAGPARADVLKQMGEAAAGRGPSLAEAQLKAAQDRTLAQQLAATQAGRGGGALAQRSLMQSMGASGRDIAQQAAIARLQERADFMNQAGAAEAGLRQDIGQNLNLAIMPKQSMQAWETGRVSAINAAQQANAAAQNQMMGALIGGAATLGAGAMGKASGGLVNSGGASMQANVNSNKDMMSAFKDGGLVEKEREDIKTEKQRQESDVMKEVPKMPEEERMKLLMEKFKKAAQKKAEGGQITEEERKKLAAEKQRQESDVMVETPKMPEEERMKLLMEKFKKAAQKKADGGYVEEEESEEDDTDFDTTESDDSEELEYLKQQIVEYACGGKVQKFQDGGEVDSYENRMKPLPKKKGSMGERSMKEITQEIEAERNRSVQPDRTPYVEPKGAEEQFMKNLAESRKKYLEQEAKRRSTASTPEMEGYTQRFPKVQNHQSGGAVSGPGTETSDSIPAMLSDGEFVIRAKEVKKPGILEHLKKINEGKLTEKDLSTLAQALKSKRK